MSVRGLTNEPEVRMYTDCTPKDIQRFWNKIDKSGGHDACWLWLGCCVRGGYGWFYWNGKYYQSHRIMWMITFGKIPDGLCILHKCDNPSCCNPDHLFLGTKKDNSDDKVRKGRQYHPNGEKNGHCKITDLQVLEIRQRYTRFGINGENSVTLAKFFGISPVQIRRIANYEQRA